MQRQQAFGRRASPQQETPSLVPAGHKPAPSGEARPVIANLAALSASLDDEVDRELEDWKAMRKIRKRSFREPWRSVCIAATLGFGVSTWLLPDSVADIAQLVTTGLCVASLVAGFRKR